MYRYGRVVLVGHSLGSVIAYDILRHYWGAVNGGLSIEGMKAEICDLEAFDGSNDATLAGPAMIPRVTTTPKSTGQANASRSPA